jgi:glycosyltransferase involved in cell wall biosynthesis
LDTTDNNIPDLSIIVLCYLSGEDVKDFTSRIISALHKDQITDYEIILVGNYHPGTIDKTPDMVRQMSAGNPKIHYVAEPKPEGGLMGWDMRSGFARANGSYLSVIDGDGQMPVGDIIKVYRKIKNENLDLVKSYRVTRGDSWRRKIVSRVYNLAFDALFPGLGSKDINSKPKIIAKDKYNLLNLQDNGWCIDAEIMLQARSLKFKIGEIPTTFLGLEGRRKSFVKLPAILEFVKFLFLYRIREWTRS